jgi:hypothetical protein
MNRAHTRFLSLLAAINSDRAPAQLQQKKPAEPPPAALHEQQCSNEPQFERIATR